MSNETLALTAVVIDKYKQPIIDLQRGLKKTGDVGKQVHLEGAKYAKAHKDSFEALRKTARETSDHFMNIFQPAMVGLGLSAVTVGASIAGLAKGLKDLGAYGREMSFASHETGLAVNSLNAWIEAGKRANITSEAMIGSLTSTNEKLSQFEKRRDSALQQFFAVNNDKPVMANLEKALRAATGDREKQDRLILETYESLKEADQHLLEEAFGEQNFRRFNSKDIDDAATKLHQFTKKEFEDLKEMQKAFDDTAAAANKLATEMELSVSGPMKEAAKAVKAFLDEHGDDLKKFLGDVAEDIKSADWKGFAEGIGKTATETKKLIDAVGGANVFQGLIALKLGGVPGLAAFGAYKLAGAAKEKLDESGLAKPLDREKGESWSDWIGRLGKVPALPGFKAPDVPPQGESAWHNMSGKFSDFGGEEKTPGAEIRAEAVMIRATMRGTAEGSRIGVLAAFHEFEDEKRRGGGFQNAAYHPGGMAGEGGLGGGYGGLGGGTGGGLGGAPGGSDSGGGETPASVAPASPIKGPHGHPGQHAILEGHVKEAAATIKAAKASMAGGDGGGGKTGEAMSAAMDQLRKEGVPQEHLRAAAAILTGQAIAESSLNPHQSHDSGRGHGIYGAGGARWPTMTKFAAEHGGAETIEGQMRAMAHEAMTDKTYGETRRALMGATQENLQEGSLTARRNFESPSVHRDAERFQATKEAYQSAGTSASSASTGGQPPKAFIAHWTGGAGTIEGLQRTLADRHLGVEYAMDREGHIRQIGGPGSQHIRDERRFGTPLGKQLALNSSNTVGMEVIADPTNPRHPLPYTAAQKKAFVAFIAKNYPNTPVYGHGEIQANKQREEGKELADSVRAAREHAPPLVASKEHIHQGQRRLLEHRAEKPDLLGHARKAGLMGAEHKVTGSASLSVDFKNMPRGVKAKTKIDGMFSQIRVARGRAMPLANQDS